MIRVAILSVRHYTKCVSLVVWWASLVLLGLGFVPLTERIFPDAFPDRGVAFAKPLALVTLAYVSWLLASLGISHGWSLGVTLAALGGAAAIGWSRRDARPWRAHWLVHEAAFLGALLLFAAVRAVQPDIFGAEKYMDFAFFNSILRADHFPPEDPWLAGVRANYYYFGYLLFADLARITRVAPAVAYNLSLATVGATIVGTAISIGWMFCGRLRYGLLGGIALAGIGNLDGAIQLVGERKPLSAFDYWRSTRVVPHTINEFPFFSLLHGDLHPHVTALVINVSLVGVALAASLDAATSGKTGWRSAGGLRLALLALLLGCLALTNPWDIPVYFTLLAVLALRHVWDDERPVRSLAWLAAGLAVLAAAMLLVSLPFSLHFQAQFQGIGVVHERTTLVPFLTVFGFLLLPPLAAVGRDLLNELDADPPTRDLVLASGAFSVVVLYIATTSSVLILAAAVVIGAATALLGPSHDSRSALAIALLASAAIALAACEVVFLRDPYGSEFHRMNTVFKLYFQAWLLLALAFPAFVHRILERLRPNARAAAVAILVAGFAASLCYPLGALAVRWKDPQRRFSLDGIHYLDRDHPADAAAIRWLAREVGDRPVVLEATGDPYSYLARVSSNTGLPTVLGWGNHEGVWRGSDSRIAERKRDVDTLYGETDVERIRPLLARYRIRYVFVGEIERERFPPAALDKFDAHPELFSSVFHSGTTEVFAVKETIVTE